jgi:hypothetical protein
MFTGSFNMSDPQSKAPYYPNTQAVYDLFIACKNAQDLSYAAVHHFDSEPNDPPPLSSQSLEALQGLIIDQFIKEPTVGQSIIQYRRYYQKKDEIENMLKAQNARKKTLTLQYKNAESEASKGGLFRGKAKQEQQRKADRLKKQLTELQSKIDQLQSQLDQGEFSLRQIAHEIQNQSSLKNARWLSADQLVLEWTSSGRFLFEFLSEIKPQFFLNTPLSHILLYGHHWTAQSTQGD